MNDSRLKHKYEIADSFILRVPLLPLHVLEEISDSESMEALLRKFYQHPIVSEALCLASPALHKCMNAWLKGGSNEGLNQKLHDSLLKYLIRMSSRCTPFGLFAGICTGSFGEDTNIHLYSAERYALFLRPDMQYLCSAAEKLIHDPVLRSKIKFYPNTSIGLTGNDYRYIEYFSESDRIRKYQLQATEHGPELNSILDSASNGASRDMLGQLLLSNEIAEDEACAYVDALIDNQVLVSDLEPVVSGPGYFEDLLDVFKKHGIESEIALSLEKIHDAIGKLETKGTGNRIDAFQSIQAIAGNTDIRFDESALIQGDMKIGFHSCSLHRAIKQDLQEAVSVLMKLARPSSNVMLNRFKENFMRRYDTMEVPLHIALDAEAGPGYLPEDLFAGSSALLEGILLPPKESHEREINWRKQDSFLFKKLQEALLTRKSQIEIEMKDMEGLAEHSQTFPISFSVLARMCGAWDENNDKPMIYLVSAGGHSAAGLAGRFCHIDEKLNQSIRDINALEQIISGDTILAEIVHLPQQRTGNVLMRPHMRKYEIPYLARSVLDKEFVIPISDLMLSVRRDKLMLRSKRLNKFIIPRMSNAHNYSLGSLAVYRFLCDMQSQDINTHPSFSWGPLESETPFLPRVTYKNFIFQAASWNLSEHDLAGIKNAADDQKLRIAMTELREKFHIPKEIVLAESDHELWLDLDHIHCLKLFQGESQRKQMVQLKESLLGHGNTLVMADDGARANEFIFFFHRNIHEAYE